FQACCCNPLNKMFLCEEKYNRRWQYRDQRHGQQISPLDFKLIHEHAQTKRYSKFLHRTEIQHLCEEIIPAPDEGKDPNGNQCWLDQREDDPPEDSVNRCAINLRCLIEVTRYTANELD